MPRLPIGLKISLDDFAKAVSVRASEKIAHWNWRAFKEAREFARSLKLKGLDEWKAYCKSGKKPHDIPNTPQAVYKDEWVGTA